MQTDEDIRARQAIDQLGYRWRAGANVTSPEVHSFSGAATVGAGS